MDISILYTKQIESNQTMESILVHFHSIHACSISRFYETIQYNPVHLLNSLDSIVTNLQNDQV